MVRVCEDICDELVADSRRGMLPLLCILRTVAHKHSGLDARCMISQLKPRDFSVASLTTIATPHRGSLVADSLLDTLGRMSPPCLLDVHKN